MFAYSIISHGMVVYTIAIFTIGMVIGSVLRGFMLRWEVREYIGKNYPEFIEQDKKDPADFWKPDPDDEYWRDWK